MKNRYLTFCGIMFCIIGVMPFLYYEEISLHYRFLGMGRWASFSGYLSPYASLGLVAVTIGISFILVSMLDEVLRNNLSRASI